MAEEKRQPQESSAARDRETQFFAAVGAPRTAVVMIGIPASGKSTFCRRYFPELPVISLDLLHRRKREDAVLRETLASGRSFVVDNTNVTRAERAKYLAAAREAGYRTVGVYMRSDTAGCLARNELRVGKARIHRVGVLARAKALELPEYGEGFDRLFYVTLAESGFTMSDWKTDHEEANSRLPDETV